MKKVSKSTMMEEVAYSYHNDPGKIVARKTNKELEKREIAEALAHIYGYG
jgi:hypothetical protein